jgi:hypothetical protein
VALGQVFSEYFGLPCQFSFHRLLHNHHRYNRPTVANVPSGLSLTPPRETKKKKTKLVAWSYFLLYTNKKTGKWHVMLSHDHNIQWNPHLCSPWGSADLYTKLRKILSRCNTKLRSWTWNQGTSTGAPLNWQDKEWYLGGQGKEMYKRKHKLKTNEGYEEQMVRFCSLPRGNCCNFILPPEARAALLSRIYSLWTDCRGDSGFGIGCLAIT